MIIVYRYVHVFRPVVPAKQNISVPSRPDRYPPLAFFYCYYCLLLEDLKNQINRKL